MSDQTTIRIALWLSIINLGMTMSHIAHDMIEFADIRFHIDQAHPGTDK